MHCGFGVGRRRPGTSATNAIRGWQPAGLQTTRTGAVQPYAEMTCVTSLEPLALECRQLRSGTNHVSN